MKVKRPNRSANMVSLFVWKDLRASTIAELTPQERWARVALKMFVCDSPYRPVVCISPGNPFTDGQIARNLMVSVAVWKSTKKKLIEWGEIEAIEGVGIRYPDYRGLKNTRFEILEKRAAPDAGAPATAEELKKNEDIRIRMMERYNMMLGSGYHPEELHFVKNIAARIEEGATEEDLDIGMRTYIWVVGSSAPGANNKMRPSDAFNSRGFWKYRKMNMPATAVRFQTTKEYIRSLPSAVKPYARKFCSDYFYEMKNVFRRNGWDFLYDADFTKVMTCKQYVMKRIASEVIHEKTDVPGVF